MAEIIGLRIKNFLSIADVDLKFGQINQIVGKNNQGKTSVLKAIEFAVLGSNDSSLIRTGEDSAEVIVELADETTIRRRMNAEGKQALDVKKGDMKASSPQSFLQAIFDTNAFNPLELLDAKRRNEAILKSIDLNVDAETLSALSGVDEGELPPLNYSDHGLKVLEAAHKYFYQRRAEANRAVAESEARVQTYKKDLAPLPEQPVSEEDLAQMEAHNQQVAEMWTERANKMKSEAAKLELLNESLKTNEVKQQKTSAEIEKIQAQLNMLQESLQDLKTERLELDQKRYLIENIDEAELARGRNEWSAGKKQLNEARNQRKLYEAALKAHEAIKSFEDELGTRKAFADKLTAVVNSLHNEAKTKLMASCEMPVEGLEYRDGEFFVNGSSVSNLSSSQSVKLAMAVARKLAKHSKLICLDGAELLDEDTFSKLHEEIKDDGFTYFITKVGEPFKSEGDKVFRVEQGQIREESNASI